MERRPGETKIFISIKRSTNLSREGSFAAWENHQLIRLVGSNAFSEYFRQAVSCRSLMPDSQFDDIF